MLSYVSFYFLPNFYLINAKIEGIRNIFWRRVARKPEEPSFVKNIVPLIISTDLDIKINIINQKYRK
jgi:hypothetical protein